MWLRPAVLYLPTSLLASLITPIKPGTAQASHDPPLSDVDPTTPPWPYNLPPHVKYWPEDLPHRRRDLEAVQEHIAAGHVPVGVRKMGVDEGEKFWPYYWSFAEEDQFSMADKRWNVNQYGEQIRGSYEEEDQDRLLNHSSAAGTLQKGIFSTRAEATLMVPRS
ncbi:MAG: hypothetical protein M1818_005090 [Claussenomyces sp. TS43310]|nr:MAG: hypothetical protein M1818_005090 [Claussenomyces sp. TS43310]